MMPGFEDLGWPLSVARNPSRQDYQTLYRYPDDRSSTSENKVLIYERSYSPQSVQTPKYSLRSIKFLKYESISADIFDRGKLSFESIMIEIPPVLNSYELVFDVVEQQLFHIEMLMGDAVAPPGSITLDQNNLIWQAVGKHRPDVYFATAPVSQGQHQLVISQIPADGITLALPVHGVVWQHLPFDQGLNAGRRMLLADYVTDTNSVIIAPWPTLTAIFADPPTYLVLDLGRTVHGRLLADVIGPSGTIIDIGWDERVYNNKRPLPFPGSFYPYWNQVDSWVLDGQVRSITTLDSRAGRYIQILVWGSEPVRLENIRIIEERYPLQQAGSFHSDDTLLNEIWQVGVDTLFPSMVDAYADPWRERGQWWGDASVEIQANMVAFGDLDLLRRGLRLMADGFQDGQPTAMAPNGASVHMLDYGMLWLHNLYDYAYWSDDWNLIRELYPTVLAFMDYLFSTTNSTTGLIDLPVGPWPQTAYIDTFGYNSRFGQSTALNSMYYHTLTVAADLAEGIGDSNQANLWRTNAQVVKNTINATLYLSDEHRYITSIRDNQVIPPSAYAQAWPLAYGIVPTDETQAVADALLDLLPQDPATAEFGVYAMNWVLAGLGRADRVPDALDLIRLFFGYMLDAGATTWWERFDSNQYYSQSLSHGWGSSPTWFLSAYVLGVKRTGPNTWELRPDFESVSSAAGTLPLQDGVLDIWWQNQSCTDVSISITAPPTSTGSIILPWSDAVITLDNEIIWNKGQSFSRDVHSIQSGVDVLLTEGQHDLLIEKSCLP
jgi:alpha-L-rhamnosidase